MKNSNLKTCFFRQSSIYDNRVIVPTLEEQKRDKINHPLGVVMVIIVISNPMDRALEISSFLMGLGQEENAKHVIGQKNQYIKFYQKIKHPA